MTKVKLKKRKSMKAAYIEHVGAYETIPFDDLISKLYGWAKEKKAKLGFKPFTIYPDDPNVTSKDVLRSWIGIPIYGSAPEGGGVKVIDLPESLVATYKHAGPASEYQDSYNNLRDWAASEGYEFIGPPIESYPKKPKVKNGQTIIYADIQFPVRKK
jgi:effector-binding domain-containing protein